MNPLVVAVPVLTFFVAIAGCANDCPLATGALVDCPFARFVTDAPPPKARDANKWWANTVNNRLDLDFLGVLCTASAVHREHKTSANYVGCSTFGMKPMYFIQMRLPLPLPPCAEAQAKERLTGWQPS